MIRDGQCPEYNVEEQAICAVGLAKSTPGIFVEAIQYLLILATPVEVTTWLFICLWKMLYSEYPIHVFRFRIDKSILFPNDSCAHGFFLFQFYQFHFTFNIIFFDGFYCVVFSC